MPDDQVFPSCNWEIAAMVRQRDPRRQRAPAAALPPPVDMKGLPGPMVLLGSSQSMG